MLHALTLLLARSTFAAALAVAPQAADAPLALHAGDTLLDHLEAARVERFPATNLPEEIRKVPADAFRMRTPEIHGSEWTGAGSLPSELAGFPIRSDSAWRWWMIKPAIRLRADGEPVRILRNGEVMLASDPSWTRLPDPYVYWDEQRQAMYALSEKRVSGVVVEYAADPGVVFAPWERMAFATSKEPSSGATPAANSLLHRFEIGKVSRLGAMAPAPAVIAFPIDRVDFDAMRVAFAVVDLALRMVDGCFVRSHRGSDGVDFAVDVECEGKSQRIWSKGIARKEVGREFHEDVVDLKPFRGKGITLRLITEPGSAGSNSFDYAVWGDLRLTGTPETRPKRPNVIIIDIDTLRADRLGCYGNPRRTSPRLDARFAKDAVVYRDAVASACWTLPSTTSILTGMHVPQHGVKQFPSAIGEGTPTLATMLREDGYETYAIAEGGYVRAAFGFDHGFDVYDCTRHKNPDWQQALDWLANRRSERPFFLFLHTFCVHAPYEADPRFEGESNPRYEGWLQGKTIGYDNVIEPFCKQSLELTPDDKSYINRQYDALVAKMDERVGAFLDELDALLQGQDYLLAFTSDHGEEFFEHSFMGHGHSLYQELLHVPLVIRYPQALAERPEPGTHEEQAASVDLVPTILDSVGAAKPDYLPGHSLLHRGDESEACLSYRSEREQSLTWNGWKLIRTLRVGADAAGKAREVESFQLFDRATDPREQSNVAAAHRDVVQRMRARLELEIRTWRHQERFGTGEADAEGIDAEQLRALGYAGGAGGGEARGETPPKAPGRKRGE